MNHSAAPTGITCASYARPSLRPKSSGSVNVPLWPFQFTATQNLKTLSSKKLSETRKTAALKRLTESLTTQLSAECVEELLNDVRLNLGIPWFVIIERKMHRLIEAYAARTKK